MFIGKYNRSVIVTYLGLLSASCGIFFAAHHRIFSAMLCLLVSGICDMFDGKIARMCKRDEDAVAFGIELDSLADIVAFVALPIFIFYNMGLREWYYIIIYAAFLIAGIIRLAYFNVLAYKPKKEGEGTRYHGLPVTTTSFLFPAFYVLYFYIDHLLFKNLLTGLIVLVSFLFIFNFEFKKPSNKMSYLFLALALLIVILLCVGRF